jgi:hypothetical protein
MALGTVTVRKVLRGLGDHKGVVATISGPSSYAETTGIVFDATDLRALGLSNVDWVSSTTNQVADGVVTTHAVQWDSVTGGVRIHILPTDAVAGDEFANAGDASALRFDVLILGDGISDA